MTPLPVPGKLTGPERAQLKSVIKHIQSQIGSIFGRYDTNIRIMIPSLPKKLRDEVIFHFLGDGWKHIEITAMAEGDEYNWTIYLSTIEAPDKAEIPKLLADQAARDKANRPPDQAS